MSKSPESTLSFNQNFKTLNDIATQLRNQSEPDIDALVPMVEKATQAYQACKARLDSVQAALQEHFDGQQTEPDTPAAGT